MRVKYIPCNLEEPDEIREIDDTLQALQECVKGYIETVPLSPFHTMIVNEDGLVKGLPPNDRARRMYGDYRGRPIMLVGDVIIVGLRSTFQGTEFIDYDGS